MSSDELANLVDHAVITAFSQYRSSNNYVRIQANGSSIGRCGLNVDTAWNPNNVKMLMGIAEEISQNFIRVALTKKERSHETQIVAAHESRQRRDRPEVHASNHDCAISSPTR
ncbi:RING-type E3 ubiquitin transferase [Psidium guajava]|nr:RING-type E3 ubiquitin transferase [Psidium guajava]